MPARAGPAGYTAVSCAKSRAERVTASAYYFVTDIEADGPNPLRNSMLSFASVVVRDDGRLCGEFEAVLEPMPDRQANPATMAWWGTQPEAWKAATENAVDPAVEMRRFTDWVGSFDGRRGFAARPLLFDGLWIDQYLRMFSREDIFGVSFWGSTLFDGQAMDIDSYAMGIFGRTAVANRGRPPPAEWLGHVEHTHRAIDDARGYANLLSRLFTIARQTPDHPGDYFGAER